MSKNAPLITDASESDVQAIIAMHAQSWLDTYPNEAAGVSREWITDRVEKWSNPEKTAARLEKILQAQTDTNILYRIAKNANKDIVGLAVSFRSPTGQHVAALYIDKIYYGTGLAQRMMDEILTWADPKQPLELEVASYNERAKTFYRKYGFEEVAGSERLYDVIPVIKMIRKGEKQ